MFSSSNDQLLIQAIGMIKQFTGVDDITAGQTTKINQFFLNAFKLLFPAIRNKLIDQSRRYIITGHSLGGAMASLLSLKMTQHENVGYRTFFEFEKIQRNLNVVNSRIAI